jgi:hypothetical protein
MPTKKIRKNKKRRSYGGKLADALNTVINGQVAAATNRSQQKLTTGEIGEQVKGLQSEFGRELWESALTGKNFNPNNIGKKLEKRMDGLEKMAGRSSNLANKVGITGLANKVGITGVANKVSIPNVGIKSSLNTARKSFSNLSKSATNSFSKDMCVIL